MDTITGAMDLLGAGRAFKATSGGERELRKLLRRGLPGDSIEILMENVPQAERPSWRKALSPIEGGRLSPERSERAGRLAYILALANEVWGGKAPAHRFLTNPHPALDGVAPLEAARTEWGGRAVEGLLRKIQFGLPA